MISIFKMSRTFLNTLFHDDENFQVWDRNNNDLENEAVREDYTVNDVFLRGYLPFV